MRKILLVHKFEEEHKMQNLLQILNFDTGLKCGPNELGEICIRTPYMMKEYLNRPEATAEYFDEEGFGHSGDVGYYDEEGILYFVDRRVDIIK